MTKKTLLRIAALLAVAVMMLGVAGCRQAALQNPKDLPALGANGQALKAAQVKEAILAACKKKGWVARELTPGVVSASLAVRTHLAEVEIPYSAASYSIIYKNSDNLDYDAKKQRIHNQYNNWVIYLKEAIEANLAEMK